MTEKDNNRKKGGSSMHTMWKGSISFGLVNIPVKLHAATEDKDIQFRTLHKKCQTPIKYVKFCPHCNVEVDKDDLVKAFEITKGKFVRIEDEEIEEIKKDIGEKTVEIIDFVKLSDIDPIYFNKSYYLSPNEGGAKAYSLLRKALEESGKVGIAKISLRSKEQLAVLRVYEKTLVMETIHYPDEVRNVKDVPNVPTDVQVSKKELDTAILLIDQLTTDFYPENYKDEYREALMSRIQAKRSGDEVITGKTSEEPSKVMDLMEALKASIDRTKTEGKKKKATGAKRKQGKEMKEA